MGNSSEISTSLLLPIYSDFNQGLGSHISLGDRKLLDAPWYNISCQSLQPLLEFNEGKNSEITQVTVDGREASYNRGGNVSFKGKLKRDAKFEARLFKPNLQLSASPILISYSVKLEGRSELGSLLRFSTPIMAPNESIGDMFLPCSLTTTRNKSDWTVHETSLALGGHTLTEISALCYKPKDFTEEETNKVEYSALLGHVSIKYQQKTVLFPPASSLIIEARNIELLPGDSGSRTLSCKLKWRLKHPEEDYVYTRYNVYLENLSDYKKSRKVMQEPRSEKVFLGTAHVDAYYVSGLVIGSDVKEVRFVVQIFSEDGS